MTNNSKGFDPDADGKYDDWEEIDERKNEDNKKVVRQSVPTIYEIQNAINTITGFFLEENRQNGKKNDSCCYRFEQI